MANDWWHSRKEELLALAGKGSPIYVYNEETLNDTLFDLLSIDALDVLFYPVHANSHPKVLRKACEMDVGFKCISCDEVTRLLESYPKLTPQRILFEPEHAYDEIFERAFHYGAHVLVNGLCALKERRGVFKDREIFIFMKMGHEQGNTGISTPILGKETGASVNHEKDVMDIPDLRDHLETIKDACPQYKLWLELPDLMVSQAGALLAEVTETGEEGGTRYIRINMDMQDSIYDGLRGAPHQIINLSKRYDEEMVIKTRIIAQNKGPENTIDFMKVPASVEKGDILLFSNMGVYGPGMDFDEKGRNSVPEHYMSARSMCQVKI